MKRRKTESRNTYLKPICSTYFLHSPSLHLPIFKQWVLYQFCPGILWNHRDHSGGAEPRSSGCWGWRSPISSHIRASACQPCRQQSSSPRCRVTTRRSRQAGQSHAVAPGLAPRDGSRQRAQPRRDALPGIPRKWKAQTSLKWPWERPSVVPYKTVNILDISTRGRELV